MILIHSEGHWKGWVLKNETFLGPELNAKNSRDTLQQGIQPQQGDKQMTRIQVSLTLAANLPQVLLITVAKLPLRRRH